MRFSAPPLMYATLLHTPAVLPMLAAAYPRTNTASSGTGSSAPKIAQHTMGLWNAQDSLGFVAPQPALCARLQAHQCPC